MEAKKAFTLIEYLVYLAMFVTLSAVSVSLLLQFITLSSDAAALQEVQDSARNVMETLAQEIRQAKSMYTPTSVLGTSPGQLTLETKNFASSPDNATYVDFYVDGQALYLKREGQAATRLTAQTVNVQNFTLTSLNQASPLAVRIQLTLVSPAFAAGTHTFVSTVSLRPQI